MKKKIIIAMLAVILIAAVGLGVQMFLLGPEEEPVPIEGLEEELAFRAPEGLLMGEDGTLYVADSGLHTILTLANGEADQVAGSTLPQVGGVIPGAYNDGAAQQALFNQPSGMTSWLGGIAISDTGNNRLRLLKDGAVQTLAGTGVQGCENGDANSATFYQPKGLAVGSDGALYVADSGNGTIRRVTTDGTVETVLSGLESPSGICWDGDILYIADAGAHAILSWNGEEVQVFAGQTQGETLDDNAGFADGSLEEAAFCAPSGVLARNGKVYVADTGNSAVRCISEGKVETLTSFQGTGGELWPAAPTGLAWAEGVLYVADPFAGIVFTLPAE